MDSNVTHVIILQKQHSKRFTMYTDIDLYLFSNAEKTKKNMSCPRPTAVLLHTYSRE